MDPVPLLDLAGTALSGDVVLGSAAAATRLSDGGIVVADRLWNTVRFFDENGSPTRDAGGEGTGPGEFDYIAWMGQCGRDSIFVYDADLARVTVLNSTGDLVRTFRLPSDPSTPPAMFLNCSREGTFAVLGQTEPLRLRQNGEWQHIKARLMLTDGGGTVTKVFGDVPAFEGRPLGKVTSLAVDTANVFIGSKDSASVEAYPLAGGPPVGIPLNIPRRPPTMDHYREAIRIQAQRLPSVDDRREVEAMMLDIPMPEYLPPYASLWPAGGALWVEITVPGDSTTWLRSVSPDGGGASDVRLPRYMTVLEVGDAHVLGTYEDEIGELHVVLHELHRGAGASASQEPDHRATAARHRGVPAASDRARRAAGRNGWSAAPILARGRARR